MPAIGRERLEAIGAVGAHDGRGAKRCKGEVAARRLREPRPALIGLARGLNVREGINPARQSNRD